MKLYTFLLLMTSLVVAPSDSHSQIFDTTLYSAMEYRSIGPFRGGRSCTVAGVIDKPDLYYFGATGGGVWKTTDAGGTWVNISDGFFGGSIGAIAVAESDHNVIYVGTGEQTVRGNVSSGNGMYKSVDAGETWTELGLKSSRHIGRIRIDPRDHNTVYVAVMGDLYKSSEERGIYKSIDGGKTWDRKLFVNPDAGAVDICFDPTNPRILYATTWRIRRTPYSLLSGGEGSGLWKSTDSGETWTDITRNQGLPNDTVGIIGVAVSPADPDRVWAMIESKTGGLFRSDNAGKTWQKVNEDRSLRQRAWYYTRIYADTQDENIVYVLNVSYHKSTDGGENFKAYNAPHGDHHDLWIAPEDNQRMIMADDGGAQVSKDGGENWSTYHNQPTAQFYRVTTDNHFPYRIYAAQQDNSTVRIAHRSDDNAITEDHWEPSAGCECGHLAIDPDNQEIVYGGCYDGVIQRLNHSINQGRAVNVWPDNPMGHGAEGMRYRFQWNFPIFFSPHDSDKLYTASNHLHMTTDEGHSWDIISPDLTRNDSSKMGSSGGPITKDNTSVEYYCTIFAAAESPRVKDLIWVGSDDGLVHITRDGGTNWVNVTPKDLPDWIMINSIEPDPHLDGGCYLAATMYKHGDYRPYLYRTKDYGATWKKITNGIDDEHFTRVLRSDLNQEGLLYAGTEAGMYISFDDGDHWTPFQLNLPIVPITDLAVKDQNLVVATQGRSLWILDDLTPLYELSEAQDQEMYLFTPKPTYRMGGSQTKGLKTAGTNHAAGVMTYFYTQEVDDSTEISLSFSDLDGDTIRTFSSLDKENKLKVKAGSNLFVWDLQYPDAEKFEGMIMWAASLTGPKALPGPYRVTLQVGQQTMSKTFQVLRDPRSESSIEDMKAQFAFIHGINKKVTEAHRAIKKIREIRSQFEQIRPILKQNEEAEDLIKETRMIEEKMDEIEKTLYQTQNQSRQDPLNFPIRLTNKLAHLNAMSRRGDYPPTKQAVAVKEELTQAIDEQLALLQKIMDEDLADFNQDYRQLNLDIIQMEKSNGNGPQ